MTKRKIIFFTLHRPQLQLFSRRRAAGVGDQENPTECSWRERRFAAKLALVRVANPRLGVGGLKVSNSVNRRRASETSLCFPSLELPCRWGVPNFFCLSHGKPTFHRTVPFLQYI
jgi:hypothetical protein